MDTQSIISSLEREWEQPTGFLGRLRMAYFEREGLEKLIRILQSVEVEKTTKIIDRRFVSLTWYIPVFMGWQRERIKEQGGNVAELDVAINKVQSILENILGVP